MLVSPHAPVRLSVPRRCRLWGKLQVLGLGTALKVLLTRDDDATDAATKGRGYELRRNEVVALVNTLAQVQIPWHHTSSPP